MIITSVPVLASHTTPYLTLPPKQALDPRAIWKLSTEARIALAELKQVGELIPNQALEYVRGQQPVIYSRGLVDQIFNQPYCRIGHRETSSKYL